MAQVIYYAVYVYAPRRRKYLRATQPRPTRKEAECTAAASRREAVIISGTLEELPATLTPEEVSRRTGRTISDAGSATTD